MSGVLTDGASGSITILSLRDANCKDAESESRTGPRDNGAKSRNIKISDLLSGKSEADAEILPGDIVTVERALPVYVIGAVNNPGPLYTRTQMSLMRAVASAGGYTKEADPGHVTVFRREGTDTRVIDVDLAKTKPGETGDELLKPFDIIDVASRGG